MYETYNPYGVYNPYYSYNYTQPTQQPINKQAQNPYRTQNMGLQGKIVDSVEVVKATDIPYDGSISYFPLTDGTAIITKQLQQDGTSKVIVYKPVDLEDNNDTKLKYITETDLKEQLENFDEKFITEDDLKEQLKNINIKDLKDIKDELKTLKRKVEDITDDIKYKKEK